jgi:hypothetical protein
VEWDRFPSYIHWVIRKLVAVNLLFALIAPLIAADRGPAICVMGAAGVVTLGEQHHVHHGTTSRDAGSHSSGSTKSHAGCVCPWECGVSRAAAVPVQTTVAVRLSVKQTASQFVVFGHSITNGDKSLPPTTGPPSSLRS